MILRLCFAPDASAGMQSVTSLGAHDNDQLLQWSVVMQFYGHILSHYELCAPCERLRFIV